MALTADVLIAGGGLGGVAAALAACRRGRSVVLTEETDWLGGQLTSQAVPPDEHPWIERFGCTASYRRLRDAIRAHYRTWYPLTPEARADPHLNPGAGFVGALCHEPRVGVAVIEALLAPYRSAGRLTVLMGHRPVGASVERDTVSSIAFVDREGGDEVEISAPYVLDATETGELLPLTRTEYVTGSESRDETGEPHAPPRADPLNMQAFSVCFALDHRAGEDHTIERPARYGFWRHRRPPFWPGPLLSWVAPNPRTGEPVARTLTPNPDPDPYLAWRERRGDVEADIELWVFRRIAARWNFTPGFMASDITLVNWPMIDYFDGPILETDDAAAARNLEDARQLSLSMLYWMQTEAPRPDGGTGYPGLRLRADVVGSSDGLAKAPYIRESRRIRARYTVVEQDVSREVRGEQRAVEYRDSVGIGSYPIDLHPTTGGDNYLDIGSHPFQIPLGALLPVRVTNLLPAAKNIGTTHITNGCFRLHPVEWNVGEAAGALAAFCLERRASPHQVRDVPELLDDFRRTLHDDGVELRWAQLGIGD